MADTICLDPTIKATLSVQEFADVAEIAISTAYAGVKDGSIPSVRLGGRIRIPTAATRRLLMLDDPAAA